MCVLRGCYQSELINWNKQIKNNGFLCGVHITSVVFEEVCFLADWEKWTADETLLVNFPFADRSGACFDPYIFYSISDRQRKHLYVCVWCCVTLLMRAESHWRDNKKQTNKQNNSILLFITSVKVWIKIGIRYRWGKRLGFKSPISNDLRVSWFIFILFCWNRLLK